MGKAGANGKHRKRKARPTVNASASPHFGQHGTKDLYTAQQATLVLGDGDFSFSRALIAHRGSAKNLVCTSFEAETDLLAKYGEKAEKCLAACAQADVRFRVDARKLGPSLVKSERKVRKPKAVDKEGFADEDEDSPNNKFLRKFDRIIFNFPHTGQQMTHLNRSLLRHFFESAVPLMLGKKSEVHITLKLKFPYTSWDVEGGASQAGLRVATTRDFEFSKFPGYKHRTTRAEALQAGVQDKDARHCKTFILVADKEGQTEHPDVQGWSATGAAAIGFKSMAREADQKLIAMARDKAARQAGVRKGVADTAVAAATATAATAALAQAAPTTTTKKKKKKKTKKQKLQEQAIAAKLATAAAPAATKAAKPGNNSSSIKIKGATKAPKVADVPNSVQPATATVKRKRLSNAEYHAAKSAARKAKKPKKD